MTSAQQSEFDLIDDHQVDDGQLKYVNSGLFFQKVEQAGPKVRPHCGYQLLKSFEFNLCAFVMVWVWNLIAR